MNKKHGLIAGAAIAFLALLGVGGAYFLSPASATETVCQLAEKTDVARDGRGYWHWKFIGGHPAQLKTLPQTERENRSRAAVPCFLAREGSYSSQVQADLVKKVREHPHGDSGTPVTIANGERELAVTEGGNVFVRKVTHHFTGESRKVSMRQAYEWSVVDKETGIVKKLRLIIECTNLELPEPPVPHKPKLHPRRVAQVPPPPVQQTPICRKILFNYTGQSGVVWNNGAAFVTAELALRDDVERDAFLANPCTGVHDSTGTHPLIRGCSSGCADGGHYPERPLALAVGLPQWQPKYTFHFMCADGVCELWVPVDYYDYSLFCVLVERYPVTAIQSGEFSTSRFDQVFLTSKSPMEIGKLSGQGHY